MFYKGKRICEPFCLGDLGINKTTDIEVTIAEGAEIGLEKLREQVAKEIELAAKEEEGKN